MSTPALDVAAYLAAQGLAVLDGPTMDTFYDTMPDGPNIPDLVVVLTDRSADVASVAGDVDTDQVLIRVRGTAADTTLAPLRARAIRDALHGLSGPVLGTSYVVGVWATNIGSIGSDSAGRPVHAVTVRVQTVHETSLRG